MFLIRILFNSDLISNDIDDSNHFFYYTSTNKYTKFIHRLKVVFILCLITLIFIIMGTFFSTPIFSDFNPNIKKYIDIFTIGTTLANIILTIFLGVIVNAVFYIKTIQEKEDEDKKNLIL